MVKVIPTNPIFRTSGERRVVEVLKETLDALWTIYYEPVISGKQPDLILFHEYQGIIILEIKDYTKSIIREVNPDFWKIKKENRIISVKSPLKQAVEYRNDLITLLSKNHELLEESGNYQGKLKIPVLTACVFPNLSLGDVGDLGIDRIIPTEKLFSREDIGPNLGRRVTQLAEQLFISAGLTEREANIVKNCIYPTFIVNENTYSYFQGQVEEISNFKVDYISFNNYVDEIYFIINKINHLIRLESARTIGIVFPVNRSLRVGTLEQFIKDLLKSRNLYPSNQSFLINITDIKQNDYSINFDYLFICDINTIRDGEDYQELKRLIENYQQRQTNIVVTSNQKSYLTEKLKNRLAGR
jgi:Nuclease-related domain